KGTTSGTIVPDASDQIRREGDDESETLVSGTLNPQEEVAMRQYFTPQELTDHFTMLPQEHVLLANKSGVNRLGFVVLFKYCQWEGRFPEHWQEVPRSLVQHIAAALDLPADEINTYDLTGRT